MNNTINAQEYLTDKNVKEISSAETKLTGELIIQDYPSLEQIILANHELTSLTINNCPNLKSLNVRNNQLTKLEFNQTPEIEQIIAGKNELSILDLTNCSKLRELIIPDNPYLLETKGLNLSTITNLNITNTSVNLTQDYEELKNEKERLLGVIETLKEGGEEGKLMLTEAIEKKALPAFQVPESRQKAKKVLILIAEAQTNRNYQELCDKWNGKGEHNGDNDFDCGSLKILMDYLKTGLNQKFFKEVIENSHLSEEMKETLKEEDKSKIQVYEKLEQKPEEVQSKFTNLEEEYKTFKQKSEEQIQELTKKCELAENKVKE
ncbi:3038_t:CDS:2 [Entrophospora sp. SA101]|nr:3038_t:CDS:2 [Entrophospora sp. SA101]